MPEGDQHEWTPISARYEASTIGLAEWIVLYARRDGDEWEYARGYVSETNVKDLGDELVSQ